MKVSIIGQGYVGLTIASFAAKHYEVLGFDSDLDKVSNLNLGISHIEGVDSKDLSSSIQAGKYKATTNASEINGSDIVIIAVPTPLTEDRKPDLSFIEIACKSIGENLTSPALVINESTSFPGTIRNVIKPTVERYSAGPVEHQYAISPERVDPGRTDWNQRIRLVCLLVLQRRQLLEQETFILTFVMNWLRFHLQRSQKLQSYSKTLFAR